MAGNLTEEGRRCDWQDDLTQLDLSRFCAAPGARLSHFLFESDGAFPTQC
jgi:hypothetical protein